MRRNLVVSVLTVAVVMALTASTGSARRIFLSNQRYLAIWTIWETWIGSDRVTCPLTLEGSFHSATLSKVSGNLVGYVTKAQVGACTGGNTRAETASLPWHVQYESFAGTLPNITSLRLGLINFTWEMEIGGLFCRAKTTQREPLFFMLGIGAGEPGNRLARTLIVDESIGIELRGNFSCEIAGRGFFEGTAEVFLLGSTSTRVLVRLVQ
jgi:hypothetical protein